MKTDLLKSTGFTRSLKEREKDILRAIVQMYILSAAPVGSRILSRYLEENYRLSPATIRNVMADLEDMGFISQTHTSSGRVPTDCGYRLYVDSLMPVESLTEATMTSVEDGLKNATREALLRDASRVLSSLSHYLSIVQVPNLSSLVIRKIQLVEISSQRILAVVELVSDIIRTVTLESSMALENRELEETARIINEKISGKTLAFLREYAADLLSDAASQNALLRVFVDSVDTLFGRTAGVEESVHIAGTQNLLLHPEFVEPERIRGVIELVENEDLIVHLLDKSETGGEHTHVLIGQELGSEQLQDYSVIVSKYRMGEAAGTLGIIGPRRMNYPKLVPLLEYIAKRISTV